MSDFIVCVAGLSQDLFQHARGISSKKFAPRGTLIWKPLPVAGYTSQLAKAYVQDAATWLKQQVETLRTSVILIYVDHPGQQTVTFVRHFFPFALAVPLAPIDLSGTTNKASLNTAYNEYLDRLVEVAVRARQATDLISHELNVEQKSPLLLPVRNFRTDDYVPLLEGAFQALGTAANISALLKSNFTAFVQNYWKTMPSNGKRCFSDGSLFFLGPGKNRHGHLRHNAKGHGDDCFLSARCRLGGRFAHDFHFDCQPVRQLRAQYPNCHDVNTAPAPSHVNIAPNDYVI